MENWIVIYLKYKMKLYINFNWFVAVLLFVLFLLIGCSVQNSQSKKQIPNKKSNYIDYYNAINKAKKYNILKLYDRSYELYDSVFNNFKPKNTILKYEYEDYLYVAYNTKNYEPINLGVKNLIEKFGYTFDYFNEKATLYNIFLKSNIDSVDYKKYRKNYLKKINFGLRDTVIEIIKRDQKYRRNYDMPDKIKKLDSIDKINEELLIYIFEKYGYPYDEIIGNGSVQKGINHTILSATLLHTKDSIRLNYFLPKILGFIKKGSCEPFIYARMVDNYQFIKYNKQIYGTYVNLELSDSLKIDSIRYSIGLPKLRKRVTKSIM